MYVPYLYTSLFLLCKHEFVCYRAGMGIQCGKNVISSGIRCNLSDIAAADAKRPGLEENNLHWNSCMGITLFPAGRKCGFSFDANRYGLCRNITSWCLL